MPLSVQHAQIVTSGSMTSDITGSAVNIERLRNLAVHCVWTGTPTGTIYIQASADGGTTYENITGASVATGGASGSQLFNIQNAGYDKFRVKYTASASTGTLNAYFSAKE